MNTNSDHGSRTFSSKWLILPKLLYFWLNMSLYSASTFIAKFFMLKWHLQEYQVAFMTSLQITIFFGAMFWSNLADRLRKPRMIVMLAVAGYAASFCCLGLPIFKGSDQGTHRIIFSSLVMAMTWMFGSCFYPVVDATVLTMLEQDPHFTKDNYNLQRLWGVPAHVLGGVVSGKAFDIFGVRGYEGSVLVSTLVFGIVAFFAIPARLEVVKAPGLGKKTAGDADKAEKGQVSSDSLLPVCKSPTWTLLSNWNFVFFLIFGLSCGIPRSALTNFQTLHMEKSFKMDSTSAAYTTIPRIASEVAVYIFGKNISDFMGNYWMLVLSQVAGLIRVFGYAFFSSAETKALPFFLEVSKGLNSGLLVTSSVRIASDIAPPGCASSAQGLFSGTYSGMSMFVGGCINGMLLYYSKNDLCFMFKWIGIFSLVCTTIFFLKYALIDRVIRLPGLKPRAYI